MKQDEQPRVSDPMLEIVELEPIVSLGATTTSTARTTDVGQRATEAFDLHAVRLKAFAIAAVRDGEAADDLVQETYLRYIRELNAGRDPDNVGGWLFRVCGNLIISRGRRSTVAKRYMSILLERGHGTATEDLVVGRDEDRRVVSALHRLPADSRVALLLAAQGHDSASIGEAIGRSPQAARTHLCRARMRLRELLDDEGPAA